MPDEDKNFRGSLVLDFRKWWRHMKTIYSFHEINRVTQGELLRRLVPAPGRGGGGEYSLIWAIRGRAAG